MDRRKAIVRDAYDAVAVAWGEKRRETPMPTWECTWTNRFLAALPTGGRVLDLGCGVGVPILRNLAALGHQAVGVDFSWSSLRQARSFCRGVPLIRADLAEVEFVSGSFNGAIAFDSIWHVPRQEHSTVFASMRRWIIDGGMALLTLAAAPEGDGELFTELLGARIYYDALPEAESLQLLRTAGFSIVDHHLAPVSEADPSRGHLIILARAE